MAEYVIDEMISAKAIAARIEALAREIAAEYAGTEQLVVVGLLRGSFVFIADLVRELDLPVEVGFSVDFEFKSRPLQGAAGMFFNDAMQRIVRAFERRAAALYGPGGRSV